MITTKEKNLTKILFNNNLNKFIIFCHSYPTVLLVYRIISLIKKEKMQPQILVVVNLFVLKNFLIKSFADDACVSVHYIEQIQFSFFNPLSILKKILIAKNLKEKFGNIFETNIIFSSKACVQLDYYVLNLVKKNNNNFCYINKYKSEIIPDEKANNLSVFQCLKLFVNRMLYGKDLDFYYPQGDRKSQVFLMIRQCYLDQFPTIGLDSFDEIPINRLEEKKVEFPYKIIFFSGGINENNSVDSHEYISLLEDVLKELNKIGIDKSLIGIKFHPSFKVMPSLLKYGEEIPKEIPADLLSLPECKVIMTVYSFVINLYDNNIKKISLLELVPWNNSEIYNIIEDVLNKERKETIRPKTKQDLISIVAKIVNNKGS
jgi:hypothetical protein